MGSVQDNFKNKKVDSLIKFLNNTMDLKNQKSEYGLIFRDSRYEDEEEKGIFLGIYKDNTIRYFKQISDFENIYSDLPLSKFEFVHVEESKLGPIIRDICAFEIKSDDEIIEIVEMLNEIDFPSIETDVMFNTFLIEGIKSDNFKEKED